MRNGRGIGGGLQAVHHGVGAHHVFGGIVALVIGTLIITAAVVLIVLLVKHFRHHGVAPAVAAAGSGTGSAIAAGKSALDILSERYARGEIDKPEFIEKKQDLTT